MFVSGHLYEYASFGSLNILTIIAIFLLVLFFIVNIALEIIRFVMVKKKKWKFEEVYHQLYKLRKRREKSKQPEQKKTNLNDDSKVSSNHSGEI